MHLLLISSGKSIDRCMYQSQWMDHIHFTIIVIRCALFCWCLCLSMHLIRMDWCTVRDFQTDDLWPTDDGQQKFGSTKKKGACTRTVSSCIATQFEWVWGQLSRDNQEVFFQFLRKNTKILIKNNKESISVFYL